MVLIHPPPPSLHRAVPHPTDSQCKGHPSPCMDKDREWHQTLVISTEHLSLIPGLVVLIKHTQDLIPPLGLNIHHKVKFHLRHTLHLWHKTTRAIRPVGPVIPLLLLVPVGLNPARHPTGHKPLILQVEHKVGPHNHQRVDTSRVLDLRAQVVTRPVVTINRVLLSLEVMDLLGIRVPVIQPVLVTMVTVARLVAIPGTILVPGILELAVPFLVVQLVLQVPTTLPIRALDPDCRAPGHKVIM
uniref:Uncharacterized protein n=1 Tax=Cacopsylla melanoneura TaxID=428564 RepID=A0A8D8VCN2_9HEMI